MTVNAVIDRTADATQVLAIERGFAEDVRWLAPIAQAGWPADNLS